MESNKAKSNLKNPHLRLVASHPSHKYIFKECFHDSKIQEEEFIVQDNFNCTIQLKEFHRVCEIFGSDAAVKMLPHSDILFVCPWLYLSNDMPIIKGNESYNLVKGRLVIPLKSYPVMNNKMTVFIRQSGNPASFHE